MFNPDKSLELFANILSTHNRAEIVSRLKSVSSKGYSGVTLDQYLEVFSESYNYDFILNQGQLDIPTEAERKNSHEFSYSKEFTSDLKLPPSCFDNVEDNFVMNTDYSFAA